MRAPASLVSLLCVAAMAGCGSEASERAALIRVSTDSCIRAFETGEGEPNSIPAGMEGRRICACAMKATLPAMDTAALRRLTRSGEPGPEQMEAIGACVVAEAQRAGVLHSETKEPRR